MFGSFILWFLLASLTHSALCTDRTLRAWLNPKCDEMCKEKNVTVIYLRADGPNDTLHYLWDFVDNPSVLLAITSSSAQLNISWEDFFLRRENSVSFTETPTYTFGVMIKKIIEFNDINDTAIINTADSVNVNVLRPQFFRWTRKNYLQNGDIVGLDMEGNSYNDTANNISRYGSMKFSLRGFCSLEHSNIIPHMLHTENSTQIDMILDHLETNSTFLNSRFAIELLIVSEGNPNQTMSIDPKKSLDDEHTPGIFEVIEVKTASDETSESPNGSGYLQWRPVSYTAESRDVTSSIETVQYPPKKVVDHARAIENSMLFCYYGKRAKDLLMQKIVILFGSKGDDFYTKTNYTTWTFIVGYGFPPAEKFSSLVIMIISIGLGLPLLIMLVAGIYIYVHKRPKRNADVYLNR